ncbi:hypothetical protein ACIHDR_03565 [Nocardia sp. NPDC052278]|uniref:hypothetical protein n=1 Tax=unclassified Nocardia TaxID=2637762 RepID=UPI00369FDCC4
MTDERTALKSEQLERIKQRDTFLNLNVVALGAISAIAMQSPKTGGVWLVGPWITAILGWAYLSNDDKVSAIARHLRAQVASTSWEAGHKGLLPRQARLLADALTFILSFTLPTPVAVALYAMTSKGAWPAVVCAIIAVEVIVTTGLIALYLASALRRRN